MAGDIHSLAYNLNTGHFLCLWESSVDKNRELSHLKPINLKIGTRNVSQARMHNERMPRCARSAPALPSQTPHTMTCVFYNNKRKLRLATPPVQIFIEGAIAPSAPQLRRACNRMARAKAKQANKSTSMVDIEHRIERR